MDHLFIQVLARCASSGLVSLGRVALDGTKLRASASSHKAICYDNLGPRIDERACTSAGTRRRSCVPGVIPVASRSMPLVREESDQAGASRTRRSREELRDLVLEAGREVLLSEGLGTGAEHLTFKRVLAHVESTTGIRVTNASVIRRIWENQEEFQLEVVRSIVNFQGDLEVEASNRAFAEALATMDLSTPELRRASLAELIRVTCDEYIRAASTSHAAIQMALATYISANLHTPGGSHFVEPFQSTNVRLTKEYMALYEAGLQLVGWRIKPGLSLADGAAAISALAEGVVMRMVADPSVMSTISQVRPLDGAMVEWSLLAVAMNQIVDFFGEADPAWVP